MYSINYAGRYVLLGWMTSVSIAIISSCIQDTSCITDKFQVDYFNATNIDVSLWIHKGSWNQKVSFVAPLLISNVTEEDINSVHNISITNKLGTTYYSVKLLVTFSEGDLVVVLILYDFRIRWLPCQHWCSCCNCDRLPHCHLCLLSLLLFKYLWDYLHHLCLHSGYS